MAQNLINFLKLKLSTCPYLREVNISSSLSDPREKPDPDTTIKTTADPDYIFNLDVQTVYDLFEIGSGSDLDS